MSTLSSEVRLAPRPAAADALPVEMARRRRKSLGPVATASAAVVGATVLAAVLAPVIAPYAPNVGITADSLAGFGSHGHLLGTDGQGRDVLSRLLWGARLSLLTGFVPVAVAGTVGTALGVIAGLAGRTLHGTVMRTLD